MAIIWPSELPVEQFVGTTVQRRSSIVRSPTDVGVAKVRRRFTAATREVRAPILLTGAEAQRFEEFFVTTLQDGALSFDWTDPVTDETVTYRFIDPASFKLEAGGSKDDREWSGVLRLEILP